LELALVHGVGDNICAGILGTPHGDCPSYITHVLEAQDRFGIRKADCRFRPYWNNCDCVKVEPANENLVCSIWQRPGKALLVLGNSTRADQSARIRPNLAALKLNGQLKVYDLTTKEAQTMEDNVVKVNVPRSSWRLIVAETMHDHAQRDY